MQSDKSKSKNFSKLKWIGLLSILVLVIAAIALINFFIIRFSQPYIYNNVNSVPDSEYVLVLGASVYRSGKLSDVLYDRAVTGIELYQAGKVKKILVSGHHLPGGYDEVEAVNNFLLEKGIPEKDILLDNQGDDTFSSLARARNVFDLDKVIITTQNFHLPRAVYIGKSLGMEVSGLSADRSSYVRIKYFEFREIFARIKALIEVTTNRF